MKEQEFNLSEKIFPEYQDGDIRDFLYASDVKEFIRLLKENFEYSNTMGGYGTNHVLISFEELDKLAGSKLVEGNNG